MTGRQRGGVGSKWEAGPGGLSGFSHLTVLVLGSGHSLGKFALVFKQGQRQFKFSLAASVEGNLPGLRAFFERCMFVVFAFVLIYFFP